MLDEMKKLYEKIMEHDNIIILRHISPDLDAISSQLAMKNLIANNFSDKNVMAFGARGASDFAFLGEVDTYYSQDVTNPLVIVCDTANYPRIEWDEVNITKNIAKVDHHMFKEGDDYGVVNVMMPECSSTCEVVFNIFCEFRKINSEIKIDANIARLLFCGTFGDTGGFIFPSTTSNTFKMLSELTTHNFDYEDTILNLRVHDHKLMKIVGYAFQNIVVNENGVGYIIFDKTFQKQNGVKPSDLSIVVNFLGEIKQLETWVVFNYHNDFIRVNLRSRSKYNVSEVANNFGGGGHRNASGAMIHTENQIQEVIAKLDEMVENAK